MKNRNRSANSAVVAGGCLLPLLVIAVGFIPSYLMTGYTVNYWASQWRECPVSVGVLPKVGITIFTPGIIIPGAIITAIADQVNPNDVLPGPRAVKQGLPTCN